MELLLVYIVKLCFCVLSVSLGYEQERARVKKVLAQEESMIPALFFNLRKVIRSSDIHTGYKMISSLFFSFHRLWYL